MEVSELEQIYSDPPGDPCELDLGQYPLVD